MPTITAFLQMTNTQVFDTFRGNSNNYYESGTFPRYLYIPGWRGDRVLLVAHVDTVWGNNIPVVAEQNGVLYNSDVDDLYAQDGIRKSEYDVIGFGIGADDRVGCWILYNLLESGHSILLNEHEEIHLGQLINSRNHLLVNEILLHKFAMEFDRNGSSDACFYNGESQTFKDYITKSLPFNEAKGTGSDISEFCAGRIPAVNLSTGYYKAHSPYEYVVIDEAEHVLNVVKKFLAKNQSRWTI